MKPAKTTMIEVGTLAFNDLMTSGKGTYTTTRTAYEFSIEKIEGQPSILPPRDQNRDASPPNYQLYQIIPSTGEYQKRGGVWCRRGGDGTPWFSITLDSPEWNRTVPVMAFILRGPDNKPIEGTRNFTVNWARPEESQSRAA